MTLGTIATRVRGRTNTNSTSYSDTELAGAISAADARAWSLITQWFDNFVPTAYSASDVSTGTATPKINAKFHDFYVLWAVFEKAADRAYSSKNDQAAQLKLIEDEMVRWYGMRNYQGVTISVASPGVFTKQRHGLQAGDRIQLLTTGTLPTGLSADTYYYVLSSGLTENTFQVSATEGGSAINTSGSPSGNHYYTAEKRSGMRAAQQNNR